MRSDNSGHKGCELERCQRHDGRPQLPSQSTGDELRSHHPGPSQGGQNTHEEKQKTGHDAVDQ